MIIDKEKLFDHMNERILDLHPSSRESSNFVEKCVLQDLKALINSGKFDCKTDEISSLVTTIESLQKEKEEANNNRSETIINFNKIKNEYFENKKLIESQKEEITALKKSLQ